MINIQDHICIIFILIPVFFYTFRHLPENWYRHDLVNIRNNFSGGHLEIFNMFSQDKKKCFLNPSICWITMRTTHFCGYNLPKIVILFRKLDFISIKHLDRKNPNYVLRWRTLGEIITFRIFLFRIEFLSNRNNSYKTKERISWNT